MLLTATGSTGLFAARNALSLGGRRSPHCSTANHNVTENGIDCKRFICFRINRATVGEVQNSGDGAGSPADGPMEDGDTRSPKLPVGARLPANVAVEGLAAAGLKQYSFFVRN